MGVGDFSPSPAPLELYGADVAHNKSNAANGPIFESPASFIPDRLADNRPLETGNEWLSDTFVFLWSHGEMPLVNPATFHAEASRHWWQRLRKRVLWQRVDNALSRETALE